MKRVPAALAVLLLHQEADASGDERLRIRPATLRKWVERGHITRGDGGYDLGEITAYVERRATTGRDRSAGRIAPSSAAVSR